MDVARAALTLERLLSVGLAIESALTDGGYMVRVIGGRTVASGVAETFLDALARASWRWVLN